MKKITCLIFMVILLLSSLFIFTGCDIYVGKMHIHIHEFNQHTDDAYLKSKATCYLPTEYYYSCYCGQKSDKTFITHQANGHNMPDGRADCLICNYVDYTRAYTVENGVITGLTDSAKQLSYLEIPQVIDGVAIAGIADWAFANNSNVMRVTIPDFIIKVGKNMFRGCNFLQSVDVQCSQVSENMFYGCSSLSNLTFSPNVSSLGKNAFKDCLSLSRIQLSANPLLSIPQSAFENCAKLYYVSLPNNLTSIGENAFKNCGLTSIVIPKTVSEISETAFSGCKELVTVNIDGVSAIANNAFIDSPAIRFLTLSKSVKHVGDNAFCNSTAIEHLIMEYGDITFGQNVFPSNLDKVNVLTAPYSLLSYCDKNVLKTVHLTAGESISPSDFYKNKSLESITLADSFTTINNDSFSDCENLKSVVLGNGITTINCNAFSWCRKLSSVHLGENVHTIKLYAFSSCYELKSIKLPSTLKTIEGYAFKSSGLTSVTIPASVTRIGQDALSCLSLMSAVFENPYGWYSVHSSMDWNNPQNGTAVDFSDPQQASFLLKNSPLNYMYRI